MGPGAATRPDEGAALQRLVDDRQFARFQTLVQDESGIWLSPAKRALLVARLSRRLRELRLPSYRKYYELVIADAAERVHMLDCITTNETHFFREPRHFDFLATKVYPRWRADALTGARPRAIRVWSAACSTGEEPYSLAMSLLRAFPPDSGFTLEILGTDLSTRALEQARSARWSITKADEIPAADLKTFMLRGIGSQAGWMVAGPELRELVRVRRLNLHDADWPGLGTFDLVFCRNVLMYFAPATKERVVGRLLRHVAPAGFLFLGHAESLSGQDYPMRGVLPNVYAHATGGEARPPSCTSHVQSKG
jgi:chemotaxis protein methyltransferase CheR